MFCKEPGNHRPGRGRCLRRHEIRDWHFQLWQRHKAKGYLQRFSLIAVVEVALLYVRLSVMGNSGAPALQRVDNPASLADSPIRRRPEL